MTAILVHQVGPGVSLQDGGRNGYLRFGISHAGPMDAVAHALANLAVGNDRNATSIEVSLGGIDLSSTNAALDIAVAGGTFTVTRDGKPLPSACRLTLKPGERLKIAAGEAGSWCYVAAAARFDVPEVLGSQATHTRSGFGGMNGRCLVDGDQIGLTDTKSFCASEGRLLATWLERPAETIRVLAGPQRDYFDAEQYQAFLKGPWDITARSDRMAIFLDGPRLRHSQGYDIVSDGIVMGSIQVPGDGLPIALMADSQSTGGYPKIATVIGTDLGSLAQMRPGSRIRFAAVPYHEALAARALLERHLADPVEVEPFVRTDFTAEFLSATSLTDGLHQSSSTASIDPDTIHARGRLTVTERLSLLFDDPTCVGADHGNAVVAEGLVYRQSVLAFAKNPASNGGTIGVREADALMLLRMRAQTEQLPLIVLYDGAAIDADHAGAGFRAFSAVSDQRARVAGLEIAVVFGESVGTDALLASLADIVVTTGTEAGVSLAGPELVRRVSNEVVSLADLAFEEGIASVQFDDEVTAILALRRLLSMLVDQGSTRLRDPEERDSPGLNYLAGRASYDMREILKSVADYGDVFELKAQTTSSVITALIQMDGFTCGVVANQPLVKLGLLTTEGMGKAADFIAFCARRRIPLLRFLDCPGILPGRMEARNRPLSAAARLLELEARLTIPPITVVTGKAIGLAAVVMGMSSTSGGRCLRWPQAAIDMRDGRDGKTELEHRNLELIVPGETRAHIIKAIRETMEARK